MSKQNLIEETRIGLWGEKEDPRPWTGIRSIPENLVLTAKEMAEDIEWYVRESGHTGTTFPLLEDRYGKQMSGNFTMSFPKRNFVLWVDVSETFCEALDILGVFNLDRGKIHIHPSDPMAYLIDGGTLNIPVVKQPNHHYKDPRWLPVSFYIGHKCEDGTPCPNSTKNIEKSDIQYQGNG